MHDIQTLTELCLNSLINQRIPNVTILDKIPYELYEKYRDKKIIKESLKTLPIVKCIVAVELFHAYYFIPSNQTSIMFCVKKKLGIGYGKLSNVWRIYQDLDVELDSNDINSNPNRAIKFMKQYHSIMKKLDIQTYVSV